MAGAGYKLFNTGDVLTAAQVNTYLNEQTVMVFASSAARTSALSGVLAEGMMSYLQDTNSVEVYNGTAWTAVGGGGLTSPLTTKGDVWGYSTTNARIPVGSNGTVLTADSAETLGVKWAAAAGGGGYTELATGSLSGSDLTLSTISGSYIDLRLYLYNVQVSTATTLRLQINGVTASTYAYNLLTALDNGVYRSQTASNIFIFTYSADTTGTNNSASMEFPNYAVANSLKNVHGVAGTYEDTNNAMDISHFVGTVNSSAAITSLKVFPSSGTFTGTYKLYGVK